MAFFVETLASAADSAGSGSVGVRVNDRNGGVTLEIASTLARDWYVEVTTDSGAVKSAVIVPGTDLSISRGWIKTRVLNDSYEFNYGSIRSVYPAGTGRSTELS